MRKRSPQRAARERIARARQQAKLIARNEEIERHQAQQRMLESQAQEMAKAHLQRIKDEDLMINFGRLIDGIQLDDSIFLCAVKFEGPTMQASQIQVGTLRKLSEAIKRMSQRANP